MGHLTDRLPATEQSIDDRAGRTLVDPVPQPELDPEVAPDQALTRLQTTVGNDGLASALGSSRQPPAGGPEASFSTGPNAAPESNASTEANAAPSSDTAGPNALPESNAAPSSDTAEPNALPESNAAPSSDTAEPNASTPGDTAEPNASTMADAATGPTATVDEAGTTSPATGAADLDTGMLELVDAELVEHERWAAATEKVGAAGSEARADFIAEQVGGGVGEGFGDGFVIGLGLTLGLHAAEKAIPGIGQVIGGVFAAHAIASGALSHDAALVARMGQGRSGYEEAANDIEGVCGILDAASNILNLLAGIVGIVAVAATAAALLSLGALSPLAVAAGQIALALGVAGGVLGAVKMALQPLVVLFRSLHAFTSQADPREIESQGRILAASGKELGGALGGLTAAAAGGALARGKRGAGEPDEPAPARTDPSADQPSGSTAPAAGPARQPLVVEGEPAGPVTPSGPAKPADAARPADDIWPEEYNVPGPPVEPVRVDLPPDRARAMLELAESGDVRGFHTDRQLFDLHQDAAARRRPGPQGEPRAEFNNLRGRMDLPDDWQGPIHHEQYPIQQHPDLAVDPSNLYATRTGTRAHQDFHSAFGEQGRPYRALAGGFDEPGIQHTFDFANTAPLPPTPATPTPPATPRPPAATPDVDWTNPTVRKGLGLDPVTGKPTGAKLGAPGQLEVDPVAGAWDPAVPGTTGPYHGSLGQPKNGEYAPESFFQVTDQDGFAVRVGPPGAYVDDIFPTLEQATAYAKGLAATGETNIRQKSALPYSWPADATGKVWPGNPVDAVRIFAVPAGTPTLRSVVAPQPEGAPAWGRPAAYPGGGPQVQLPKDFFPRGAPGAPSPAQVGEPIPITDRAEGWYTRLQRYPGDESAARLAAQGAALDQWSRLPVDAQRAAAGGAFAERLASGGPGGGPAPDATAGAAATAGPAPDGAAASAAAGAMVELVNPSYQPPPATQAELDRLTAELRRTLAARAEAARERDHAERVRDAVVAQRAQVEQAGAKIADAQSIAREHQGAVGDRAAANQQAAAEHQQGGAKVGDAASRLAGVGTLEVLLAGWSGFTGVVLRCSSLLPDRAVNAFQRMNNDSVQFMAKLAHIKSGVAEQQGQQPTRGAQIEQTGQRISATATQASASTAEFTSAQHRAAELARTNAEHGSVAEQSRERAGAAVDRADATAEALAERRQTLAERMAAWAAEHRAARQQAIEEAARRLAERGLRVTRKPEP